MKIKNLNKEFEIKYQTEGAVGIDLASSQDLIIEPRQCTLVPLGIVVEAPEGTMIMLTPRSSLFIKKGLMLSNSVGIIDKDYCGEYDEIKASLLNMTENPVKILKNERICQIIAVNVSKSSINLVESMGNDKNRGGFGSTGTGL